MALLFKNASMNKILINKKFVSFLFVLFFSLIAGFALLRPGLPPTHDGEYHIVRFYEFNKTLSGGDWYPRWAPDLNKGYGVPLFNYVYPLPNYFASFLHALGFSFIDAFKLNMFVATLIGGAFFYLWAKQFWGTLGGVVSSVFYTFSPYHFVDIYIRGSVGEVWALAFFPAFLWSVTMFFEKRNSLFVISSSLFLTLIIFSHNILALIFFPFALSYIAFLLFKERNKKYLILNTLYIILLSLGLSSIFWMPALMEQQYVRGLQIYEIEKNFPELYQLLIPSWGSGFSQGSLEGQMSFQIGIANLTALFLSFVSAILFYKNKDKHVLIIGFFLCWFLLVFFLMLKVSMPIWQYVPFMNFFQFPWRFLSLAILTTSFLAGTIFSIWRSKILAGVLIVLAVLLSIGYAKPAYYHERQDKYYLTRSNFIDGTNSPGNSFNTLWFNTKLPKKNEKFLFVKGEREIKTVFTKATSYQHEILVKKPSEIVINIAYFPGWKVLVDEKTAFIQRDKDGLMRFSLSEGKHIVTTALGLTNIAQIATATSLFSFMLILSFFVHSHVIMKK